MLAGIIFLSILSILTLLAAREKQRLRNLISRNLSDDTIDSPFSKALTDLVGIAGGIYLSLIMLITFLGIHIPEKVALFGIDIDPIAVVAVLMTLLQPLALRLWYYQKLSGK
ncbi:hypothetical protein MFMK1_002148 [Metallumcola ferriviriculae]|uniref:H(+)-exporting diphosphatase n=1 Tax=Metallumcola ferriviriculae TaxID=3039180 RepID=A0AAU0UQ23_9FIRM|nr:hypothetical protein MFMK1_002148 [Desulfitibacteraceae bacterium MK1]